MNRAQSQKGSGLIGVLIALIVIAIGGVAITGLLGNMTAGSGEAKARNEALELAREKVEELRNFVEKAKFRNELVSSSPPHETITGKNALFTREWTITTEEGTAEDGSSEDLDNLKRIVMQVSYIDPKDPLEEDGTTEKRQKVLLNSFIAFSDPVISATIATGGSGDTGGLAPSTDLSAIEGPEDDTTTGNGTLDPVPGEDAAAAERIYTSENTNGNLVVYQGDFIGTDVPDDQIKLTVFGGKLLRFSGILHYGDGIKAPETNLYVRGTSPSFCTWFPALACDPLPETGFSCGYYVCYAGGDCSNGGDGCTDTAGLPTNLNGGWYGRIGVYYLDKSEPFSCVVDDEDNLIPARLYVSERWESATPALEKYEGINSSYDGTLVPPYNQHNFIRVKTKPDCRGLPPDLAYHSVIRCLLNDAVNTARGTNQIYETTSTSCAP